MMNIENNVLEIFSKTVLGFLMFNRIIIGDCRQCVVNEIVRRNILMKKEIFNNNSLSRLIAEKITEEIVTGELKPGEKLVETNYADEFGTSRAPIREALYLLTIEGLVERIPRKGTLVKGYTNQDIKDLLEIRMMLESLAMERIAEFGVVETLIEKMENIIDKMKKINNSYKTYASLNHDYHMCIVEMSQSEMIKNMYTRLGLPLLTLQRISFLKEENIKKSLDDHILIVKMLKENKVDEAKKVLTKHNDNVVQRVDGHKEKR